MKLIDTATANGYALACGDCRDVLRTLPDNSVDSIVTDPPYELGFMGKAWDSTGIAYDVTVWRECLRVLKPGGHLLAFGGSRTYHRLACAVEDAGFEIRDQIQWVYGSGFPKSHDVSKAIDKAAGAEREIIETIPDRWAGKGSVLQRATQELRAEAHITAPATDAAREWAGWGTALKPAHEPIVMARKPLTGTVADNVQTWGTGAVNVDACRVGTTDKLGGGAEKAETVCSTNHEGWDRPWKHDDDARAAHAARVRANVEHAQALGRWPANLIHDGSDEVVRLFPVARSSGVYTVAHHNDTGNGFIGKANDPDNHKMYNDTGSAARFFYCAKASKRDRDEGLEDRNTHATVKPTDLMRYLCRLVTPAGGVVLDPFAGSGSTGKAAILEGFRFIGIELEPDHVAIAEARIAHVAAQVPML